MRKSTYNLIKYWGSSPSGEETYKVLYANRDINSVIQYVDIKKGIGSSDAFSYCGNVAGVNIGNTTFDTSEKAQNSVEEFTGKLEPITLEEHLDFEKRGLTGQSQRLQTMGGKHSFSFRNIHSLASLYDDGASDHDRLEWLDGYDWLICEEIKELYEKVWKNLDGVKSRRNRSDEVFEALGELCAYGLIIEVHTPVKDGDGYSWGRTRFGYLYADNMVEAAEKAKKWVAEVLKEEADG